MSDDIPRLRKEFADDVIPVAERWPRTLLGRAAWIGAGALIVLSVVSGENRPHTGYSGHAEHFAAYFLTAAAFALASTRARPRLLFLTALVALSVAMEICQLFVPGRHPAVSDAVASSLGACLGMLGGTMIERLATGFGRRGRGATH